MPAKEVQEWRLWVTRAILTVALTLLTFSAASISEISSTMHDVDRRLVRIETLALQNKDDHDKLVRLEVRVTTLEKD